MKILFSTYFDEFSKNNENLNSQIQSFLESSKELDFDYLIESSSVYSSNIEGNTLDLNSFMNEKNFSTKKTKDVEEIDNLIGAYDFAKNNILNEKNFLHIHKMSSKTLLIPSKRGKYRDDKVGVFGKNGLIYLAIEPEFVAKKMKDLFEDIDFLLSQKLSQTEIFYYASLIHLVFVHIHPFADGNGRTARLLEKWFLVSHLGENFWKLQSEKYYKEHRQNYYENINLGVNFYELDYKKSHNFLNMLPHALFE